MDFDAEFPLRVGFPKGIRERGKDVFSIGLEHPVKPVLPVPCAVSGSCIKGLDINSCPHCLDPIQIAQSQWIYTPKCICPEYADRTKNRSWDSHPSILSNKPPTDQLENQFEFELALMRRLGQMLLFQCSLSMMNVYPMLSRNEGCHSKRLSSGIQGGEWYTDSNSSQLLK
jgi:hypothetical protein